MQIDTSWHGLIRPGRGRNYFGIDRLPPFDPERIDFSPVNAFWLSEMCRLIYRRNPDENSAWNGSPTRHDFLAQVACREVLFIRGRETQCALIQPATTSTPFAVLVFRGTTGFCNWRLNLDFRPDRLNDHTTVHRGFSETLQTIWHRLRPALDGLAAPCFFTGHSMGGALAQLAATRFRPQAVYCFGAPRVGDRGFTEMLRTIPVFRIVNNQDIVTRLPPANLKPPFRPAGRLVYISAQGLLRQVDDEDAADLPCRTDEASTASSDESRWFDPPRFLADHAPINYSARIGQYLQSPPADIHGGNRGSPFQRATLKNRT